MFMMINEDHCFYVKKSESDLVILFLYVDDFLLAEKSLEYVLTTKE